jgi:adenylate cyclase 9
MCAILPATDPRKSASLQALTNNYSGNNSVAAATPPAPVMTPVTTMATDRGTWHHVEQIGGKISVDLANGSSANNSGRGSRSSGLQDAGSEVPSVGGLDTAISHHHNAASLTRFDTENRDFDQRLAQIMQSSDGSFARGFWMHQDSLSRWTLRFLEKDIENEYRAHFGDSCDKNNLSKNPLVRHHQLDVRNCENQQSLIHRPRYRYSGVFIDILVSALIFGVVATIMFVAIQPPRFSYIIFCIFGGLFLLTVLILIGFPLLSRKSILPCVHRWAPRHILGCFLIGLPVGVAVFNMVLCTETDPSHMFCIANSQINKRLLYSYVFLISIYAHCNFSQLGAWPKTLQAIFVAFFFLASTYLCQLNLDKIRSFHHLSANSNLNDTSVYFGKVTARLPCNHSLPVWSYGVMHTPLFVWELAVDVFLAVVLVAFLNYQFETSFRMSFFGDVQARRDTEKMQKVRDQADWLLTNIIPQHAVESLKTNTKYSENHNLTAVLFASITNWNEMYEENFEGGREFLRVLNEVIADFDDLLERPEFTHVEKIKTIGATYMAASGLNPDRRRLSLHPYEHLYQLIEFALALQNVLDIFNQDLLNFEFVCKLGLNIGPVTAGVIGTTKLYYDIWGDTVNIASRMYSTGVENRIQVSQYTRDLLIDRYDFEYRDHIEVKGVDGGMDTYLLVGRKGEPPLFPLTEPAPHP